MNDKKVIVKEKEISLIALDDGQLVLLDEVTGSILKINKTTALIWNLISNNQNINTIVQEISKILSHAGVKLDNRKLFFDVFTCIDQLVFNKFLFIKDR